METPASDTPATDPTSASASGRSPDATPEPAIPGLPVSWPLLAALAFFAEGRLAACARGGASPVVDDLPRGAGDGFEGVRADVASPGALIRHDPEASAAARVALLRRQALLRRSA